MKIILVLLSTNRTSRFCSKWIVHSLPNHNNTLFMRGEELIRDSCIFLGNGQDAECGRGFRKSDHKWYALIRTFEDIAVQRNCTEEGNAGLLREDQPLFLSQTVGNYDHSWHIRSSSYFQRYRKQEHCLPAQADAPSGHDLRALGGQGDNHGTIQIRSTLQYGV